MGNFISSPAKNAVGEGVDYENDKNRFRSFPGSAILEKTFCGSIDTTDPAEYHDVGLASRLLKRAEIMCVSSPISSTNTDDDGNENNSLRSFVSQSDYASPTGKVSSRGKSDMNDSRRPINPSSAMFARALVSEVTDNPKTMKPADMAMREKKLMKAQNAALATADKNNSASRPVGTPGGIGPTHVLGSLAYACTGDEAAANVCINDNDTHRYTASAPQTTSLFSDNRAAATGTGGTTGQTIPASPYQVTIGLSLSRRHSGIGHPDTITRQTAFDFNELQDRQYKYVSSTDQHGWRAGGGEPGGKGFIHSSSSDLSEPGSPSGATKHQPPQQPEKLASPDTIHLPIIHIDCPNAEAVDGVIAALASGEIFIPHMTILPEALSVSGGGSPPDLIVRFGCERNDDVPPDDWPNWCLEFMHNQLYEYFYNFGARWMKRPFNITLAKSVRWKTVKHMNRYFAHAEHIIESWRERGPQCLDPQLSYIDGGATPEEVAKPHGIYLYRTGSLNGGMGTPTNYFSPNFDPPYTTKMTRSLLLAVLGKSWDKKRREWTSEQMPRLVEPATLMAAACGCTDPNAGGFLAKEVTASSTNHTSQNNSSNNIQNNAHHVVSAGGAISSAISQTGNATPPRSRSSKDLQQQQKTQQQPMTHSEVEFGGESDENDDAKRKSTDPSEGHGGSRRNADDDDDFANLHKSEEKKSDEPFLKKLNYGKSRQNGSRMNNSLNSSLFTDDEGQISVTASGYETSIAASGTTVPRTNTTHKSRANHAPSRPNGDGKDLYSDEDWDRSGLTPRTLECAIKSIKIDDDEEDGDDAVESSFSLSEPTAEKPRSPSWSMRRKMKKNLISAALDQPPSMVVPNPAERVDERKIADNRYTAPVNEKIITTNISSASSTTVEETEDDDDSAARFGDDMPARLGQSTKDALKREQQRQAMLIAKVRSVTDNKDGNRLELHDIDTNRNRARGGDARSPSATYSMPSKFKVGNALNSVAVEQTYSGMSLEYSTDGSSLFQVNDQSSLFGQNLTQPADGLSSIGPGLSRPSSSCDSDSLLREGPAKTRTKGNDRGIPLSKSNSSNDDSDSLLRDAYKHVDKGNKLKISLSNDSDSLLRDDIKTPNKETSRQQQHQEQHQRKAQTSIPQRNTNLVVKTQAGTQSEKKTQKKEDADSMAYISIQESASYTTATTVVPTDEELYKIGWAKALDHASGNYYYFTLDRTKTVWENPLAQNDGNSSAWGDGTASEVTTSSAGLILSPRSPTRSPTRRIPQQKGRFDP